MVRLEIRLKMKYVQAILICGIFSNLILTSKKQALARELHEERFIPNATLIFAHVIYRHGDRNIEKIYPNDPYKDEIHWPGGIGELTNDGKRRHFALGQFLRRRYGKLIGNKYSFAKVFVQSSDVDRTIMSALANCAGLFYPSEEERWNGEIPWQPIPVHTVPKALDYKLYAGKVCKKYVAAFEKFTQESVEVQRIYSEHANLFHYWSEKCGSNISTIADVYMLYNTLVVEKEHNKTLPQWAEEAIQQNGVMEHIAISTLGMWSDNAQLAQLSSGFLLKDMLQRFSEKIKSTLKPDRTLWIYSTHYYVIVNILNGLGLFEPHLPPYASCLLFELYRDNENKHYIQLFYRKGDEEQLLPLQMGKIGNKCTVDEFITEFQEIIPGDFDSECRLKL